MKLSKAFMHRLAETPAYLLPPAAAGRLARQLYKFCYRLWGRESLTATARAVQLTRAEPLANARAIALSCFAAKGQQRSNYRSMANHRQWRCAQTHFTPLIHRLLADTSESLVVLTLHQADYLAGLLAVLKLVPVEREIHIIKLAQWSRIEEQAYTHFRKYGHTLVIHRLSEKPAKRIVRALKRQAILLTFVDVPREFGATTSVTLFDLPFQLTSGPLVMARLAQANVLPVFSNYGVDGRCEIRAGAPINGRNKLSVPAMAQELASQIEANLQRYAEQWEMWPLIPNLFDTEALAKGSASLSSPALARLAQLGAMPADVAPDNTDERRP